MRPPALPPLLSAAHGPPSSLRRHHRLPLWAAHPVPRGGGSLCGRHRPRAHLPSARGRARRKGRRRERRGRREEWRRWPLRRRTLLAAADGGCVRRRRRPDAAAPAAVQPAHAGGVLNARAVREPGGSPSPRASLLTPRASRLDLAPHASTWRRVRQVWSLSPAVSGSRLPSRGRLRGTGVAVTCPRPVSVGSLASYNQLLGLAVDWLLVGRLAASRGEGRLLCLCLCLATLNSLLESRHRAFLLYAGRRRRREEPAKRRRTHPRPRAAVGCTSPSPPSSAGSQRRASPRSSRSRCPPPTRPSSSPSSTSATPQSTSSRRSTADPSSAGSASRRSRCSLRRTTRSSSRQPR